MIKMFVYDIMNDDDIKDIVMICNCNSFNYLRKLRFLQEQVPKTISII